MNKQAPGEEVENENAAIEPDNCPGYHTGKAAGPKDNLINRLPSKMDMTFDIVVEVIFDTELRGDLKSKFDREAKISQVSGVQRDAGRSEENVGQVLKLSTVILVYVGCGSDSPLQK